MQINNAELLDILLKDVFGSITLNLEKWEGLSNAQFSIGRTYFNDRFKQPIPLNRSAAEKLQVLYRHALTEGSGCGYGYDAKKISRKLCDALESLILGEDLRCLVFLFSDTKEIRSNKLEFLLSILDLLLSMAENEKTIDLDKLREIYTQELKSELLKSAAFFSAFSSNAPTSISKNRMTEQQAVGFSMTLTPTRTKTEILSEQSIVEDFPDNIQSLLYYQDCSPERTNTFHIMDKTSFPGFNQHTDHANRLIGSVIYTDATFVGREEELEQIHDFLGSQNNKLFLSGMGGIGKSELARQYINRHREDYRLILWISASGSLVHTIADDFLLPIRGMSRIDYPNDSEEDYFRRKCFLLRELADKDVLVVLDNYDTEDNAGLWEFLGGKYTVIFTTRIVREDSRLKEMRILPLHETADLRKIFQMIYTRNMDADETVGLDRLISLLGRHTLSVRIVASILKTRRISPVRMADLLSQRFWITDNPDKKASSELFTAIREIFSIANLSDNEKYLLKNLACIPLCGICAKEFFKWCAFDDYDVLEGLIRKNLVMHLSNTDEVFLHPVIASIVLELLFEDDEDVKSLVYNFCLLTFHLKQGILSEKERYLSFAEHMVSIPFSSKDNRANARIALGYMYHYFSRFSEAQIQFFLASKECDSPEMRAWFFQLRAQLKNFEGMPEEGDDLARQGLLELTDSEIAEGEKNIVFVFLKRRLYSHLAESYRFRGDSKADALYCEKALKVMDSFFGGISFDTETGKAIFQKSIDRKTTTYKNGIVGSNTVYRNSIVASLYLELVPEQEYGWSYYHMGESSLAQHDLKAAQKYAQKSQNCFVAVRDMYAETYTHKLLGHMLYLSGNSEGALTESLIAYDRLFPLTGKYSSVGTLAWILFLYREIGDTTGEERLLCKMHELYNKEGVNALVKEVDSLKNSPWINPSVLSMKLTTVLRKCGNT